MTAVLGFGSLEKLPGMLGSPETRILLVTGGESYERSGAAAAIEPLLADHPVTRFSGFSVNPKLEEALEGVDRCRAADVHTVLAVGGGSVMDTAKLVALFSRQAGDPRAIVTGKAPIERAGLPVIAVPTTAGSGSEATQFAVVYVDKVKYTLTHDSLRPNPVIVDPGLTRSMPPRLSAVTGLDALSQAIESFWSVGATEDSQAAARKALGYLLPHIEAVVQAPDDATREAMSRGAYWAGRAIDHSRTTGAHALSYGMTTGYGIPHGHAVALTIGPFLEFNAGVEDADCNHPGGAAHVRATMDALLGLIGARSAADAHAQWIERMEALGLPGRLGSAGIPRDRVEALASGVNLERAGNNPRRMDADATCKILNAAA